MYASEEALPLSLVDTLACGLRPAPDAATRVARQEKRAVGMHLIGTLVLLLKGAIYFETRKHYLVVKCTYRAFFLSLGKAELLVHVHSSPPDQPGLSEKDRVMRCNEASQQLQLYLDNRLTLQEVRTLEAHLTSCNACLEELTLFESVVNDLEMFKVVVEPDDLNAKIMRRVAMAASQHTTYPSRFSLWRPSFLEILVAAALATIATIGTILQQPSIRSLLPFANGHDGLSMAFLNILHLLMNVDSTALILALWIAGTFLGVCITLIFAGSEMRTQWFKAMMERLPVR